MKRTSEIPRERWQRTLDDLAERYEGRTVRLEVEGRDLGAQEMVRRLPLAQIEYGTKGSAAGRIEISVGEGGPFRHRIRSPLRIEALENEAGELEALHIVEEDGAKTILYLEHPPQIPEQAPPPA